MSATGPGGAALTDSLDVVVIGGGPSVEHEVSLASAEALAGALRRRGHRVQLLIADRAGDFASLDAAQTTLHEAIDALRAADVAVPALHGPWGEDGTIAGFLDVLHVPYVGSGVEAAAIAMDKDATKRLLAAHGLPVADGRLILPGTPPPRAAELVGEIGLPCMIKPTHAGSSIGISRVERPEQVPAAVAAAHACGHGALVEPLIEAREVDVAIVELPNGRLEVGPPLEIVLTGGSTFFDYDAKYVGGVRFDTPADLPAGVAPRLKELACEAFEVLGCRGLARVDFFVPPDNRPLLNEVNTFPGMTEHSQLPQIFAAAGRSFEDVADLLVRTAVSGAPAGRDRAGSGRLAARVTSAR